MSVLSIAELMEEKKRQRLNTAGWVVSSTPDFLELTKEEQAEVERKLREEAEAKER